jgi:hypothetical protein
MSLCIRFISGIIALPLTLSQYITLQVSPSTSSSLGVTVPNLYIFSILSIGLYIIFIGIIIKICMI